jgi:hypothetical protein
MTALQWAVETFGAVARNRDERAARLVEEAIELAQAEGVGLDVVERIARHVYSKPAGDPVAELQGVALTLDACAENMGDSVAGATARELARVRSRSTAEWKARHDAKVAAGRANLSPVGE